jgi:hypothetical protein
MYTAVAQEVGACLASDVASCRRKSRQFPKRELVVTQ